MVCRKRWDPAAHHAYELKRFGRDAACGTKESPTVPVAQCAICPAVGTNADHHTQRQATGGQVRLCSDHQNRADACGSKSDSDRDEQKWTLVDATPVNATSFRRSWTSVDVDEQALVNPVCATGKRVHTRDSPGTKYAPVVPHIVRENRSISMSTDQDTRRPDDDKEHAVHPNESAAHRESRWQKQHGAEDASTQQPSEKSAAETDIAAGESPA